MFFCLPFKPSKRQSDFEPDCKERRAAPSYYNERGTSVFTFSGAGSASILCRLRGILTDNKLDAYVISNEDEHGSEIPAASELRRGFMTGFHGGAGLAVVTQSEALLFVDSRYWIAAEKAMDLPCGRCESLVCAQWSRAVSKIICATRIGVDARLIPPALKASLDAGLLSGSKLVCQLKNLVDEV
ncbi:hypothetical protein B0H17DRAFT_1204469 [Mycena rosella]|uniref:Creatinase N-terminal domain-containing protein n=1 Tax=Mycena rosella TaxID=1033263 RepID=A0AAD7GB62_MYCRO|nr:hypothetical protein B0H17DRAFT_1204469 [Mycena rosella]